MKYLSKILYLLGYGKKRLPFMIFLFVFLSFLDLIGISLIGPYVALVVSDRLLTEGFFYELIVIFNFPQERQSLLLLSGIALIGLFLFKSIVAIVINKAIILFSNNQKVHLQKYLMRSFQDMDYSNYIGRNSSEYIQSIQGYVDNYRGVLLIGLRAFSDSIMAFAILMMLLVINPIAVFVLTLLIGLSAYSYDAFFRNKVPIYGKLINEAKVQIIRGTYEGIKGFKEIKIIGKESYFYNLVSRGAKVQSNYDTKSQIITTAPRYLLELLMISFVVFMVLTSSFIGIDQNAILPVLSMFGVAALRLIPSANTILSSVVQFRVNKHAISRLYDDLILLEEQKNNSINQSVNNQLNLESFKELSINNVFYSYVGQKNSALKGINIKVNKGDTIGIIGSSGSGKTTLIDIMLGLLRPYKGQVLCNNIDISDSLKFWQSQIAYLPQQVFLIDGSLQQNIALGDDNYELDKTQLQLAIKKSRLTSIIKNLPDGIDTLVGEDGIKLSGGQRQRVALARAFYHKREILIMDESTSALDNDSELEIIEEIKALKRDKTIIIIAHSMNFIKDCDYIYRLEGGKILDHGKYSELVS